MKGRRKTPIQIYLDPEQERIVDLLSKASGQSKAAIIRSCISQYLSALPPEKDPAMNIMALGKSGRKDISREHDGYLTSLTRKN